MKDPPPPRSQMWAVPWTNEGGVLGDNDGTETRKTKSPPPHLKNNYIIKIVC